MQKYISPQRQKWMPKVAYSASMGFAAYWAYLYLSQTKHIFSPKCSETGQTLSSTPHPEITPVRLPVGKGIELEGWVRLPAGFQGGNQGCAIYFGGRSEDVRWLISEMDGFGDLPLVFFNYRGYGQSGGRPDEKRLVADAHAIYNWVSNQPWCKKGQISVIGRSLGTGVAVQLAASQPVHKLVLLTPYDSLVNLAKARVPLAPVSLLLRSQFKSADKVDQIHSPTFVLLAEQDEVVPHDSTARLLANFVVKPLVATVKGSNHVSLPHHRSAQALIEHFLCRTSPIVA